jgi:hypothetical protein
MFSWGIDSISRGPPRLARYRRAFLVWIPALLALMLTDFFSAILATFEGPWRPVARRRVCLCMVALIAVFLAQLSALLCSAGTVVASGFGPMAFGRLLCSRETAVLSSRLDVGPGGKGKAGVHALSDRPGRAHWPVLFPCRRSVCRPVLSSGKTLAVTCLNVCASPGLRSVTASARAPAPRCLPTGPKEAALVSNNSNSIP